MKLFALLRTLDPDLDPAQCKVHLATQGRTDHPLDLFFEGDFEDWQDVQTQRNFERAHIVSLIQMPETHKWLFAGCYDSHGSRKRNGSRHYIYETTRRPLTESLVGRLVAKFERTGRQAYLVGENWVDELEVAEIRAQRLSIAEFPGYSNIQISKSHLDIGDRSNGKLYVGSATGEEGIWSRWTSYSKNGHGGNKELRALLKKRGPEHADNFVFGILEVAGTHDDDLLARESYWKEMLLTREFGMNAN
jgi:hypothetical protein